MVLADQTDSIPAAAEERAHEHYAAKRTDTVIQTTRVKSVQIELADALDRYETWAAPTVIIADGPYGLGLFPGDPPTPADLAEWYAPHIAAWARYSLPETTLWFWGNEIGWATVHPVLSLHGWQYRALHIWDKGIGHIAGNVNSKTIRRFPVVTEVCAQYVREALLPTGDGQKLPIRDWLRAEWVRTGMPFSKTNEACGVKNAATRKYFTQDHLWYFPPPEMMERLAAYANAHGRATGWHYFSLDGQSPVTAEQWEHMRAKWHHTHGITNVWSEPPIRGQERLKDGDAKCLHANQKPLRLFERIINASSDPGDVVWEPFGGLCSAAVAALRTGRLCYSSEINPAYYPLARDRVLQEASTLFAPQEPMQMATFAESNNTVGGNSAKTTTRMKSIASRRNRERKTTLSVAQSDIWDSLDQEQ
jgi:site-specific DNA-methyltransferase (adenine-specific)